MTKLATSEKSILFMNNMAGDDLWEYGHLLLEDHSKSSPPHELLKYNGSSRASYNSEGVYMTSIPYIAGKNGSVRLYGFPFLSIEVDPSEIEYPSPISGVVITQDMRMLDYFIELDPNFHHIAKRQTSRLAWAKSHNMPAVLAVHHAEGHKGKMMDLNRLVGMEIFCPVIWHNGEPNAQFFRKAIEFLLSEC